MVRHEDKQPEITVAGELGPQLGTDKADLVHGRVDMRRLTKINTVQVHVIGYFLNVPKLRGGRFWQGLCGNILNLSVSEDGWRTNKVIQGIAAESGTPSIGELAKKPGLIQRNITDRGWKKRAEEKGQTIVE